MNLWQQKHQVERCLAQMRASKLLMDMLPTETYVTVVVTMSNEIRQNGRVVTMVVEQRSIMFTLVACATVYTLIIVPFSEVVTRHGHLPVDQLR